MIHRGSEKPDPVLDAFVAGTLDKNSMQDSRFSVYGDTHGTYAPIYGISKNLSLRVRELSLDSAALSTHLDGTAVYGFIGVDHNVLVPLQSCRNLNLNEVWGCFDVDPEIAQNLVKEYTQPSPWFSVHVPQGWSFERTHEMIRAFNFERFGHQDPILTGEGAHEVFSKLAEPTWMLGVRPLAGSKFS